jgi:excisionase family DNA binding protein
MRQSWDQSFGLLEGFVDREGHALVPHDHIEIGYRLGEWVHHQRRSRMAGRLSGSRTTLLERLPGWSWAAGEARWAEVYGVLRDFARREGDCRINADHVEDGVGLGRWVRYQQSRYRRGMLTPERAACLECLPGWSWEWERQLRSPRSRRSKPTVAHSEAVAGPSDRQWVNVREAAVLCRLSKNTIRRFVEAGKLRASEPDRGFLRIEKRELEVFIERSRVGLAGRDNTEVHSGAPGC